MRSKSNDSLGHAGLPLGRGAAAALLAGFSVAVAACPGPDPSGGAGASGSGGQSSSSTTASSMSEASSSGSESSVSASTAASSSSTEAASSSTSASSSGAASSSSSSSTSSSTSASSSSSGSICSNNSQICVAPPPMGWKGPVEVSQDPTVSPCPSSTSVVLQGGSTLIAPDALCSACHCGQPADVTCTVNALVSTSASCASISTCAMGPVGSNCSALTGGTSCPAPSTTYVDFSAVATGGSCTPSMEITTLTPAMWAMNVVACGSNQVPTPCSTGVCAPDPTGTAFQLCIYQDGDTTCPAGPYTVKISMDTGFTDDRGCSPCGCDAPSAKCSGGSASISSDATCSQGALTVVPSGCIPFGSQTTGPYYAQLVTQPTPGTGLCTPTGGAQIGAANPTGPTTLCCM